MSFTSSRLLVAQEEEREKGREERRDSKMEREKWIYQVAPEMRAPLLTQRLNPFPGLQELSTALGKRRRLLCLPSNKPTAKLPHFKGN